MAKTKRTVEEAEVVAAAAASNDSKLITQSKLSYFATKLWAKIKERYDEAFVGATLTPNSSEDKKLTFTRKSGQNQLEIDLASYARLTDKNDFKQDVSADNVAIIDNRNIGTDFGVGSRDRSLGFRRLTTDSFSDGYVDHIRVNIPNSSANTSATSRWYVWAIKQGTNGKIGDTVTKVVCDNVEINVDTINENSQEKKFVRIPVKDSFENGTYFIVRCTTHELEIVNRINPKHSEDVVNMNKSQPPMTPGTVINWTSGDNVTTSNTVVMQLFGRESIGSLSLKLKQTQSDSSLYVKHSETTDGTEQGEKAGKVVKLGADGKLNSNMLPSIAIGEYFEISEFTDSALQGLNHYENGDTVVVTGATDTGARYLCINKGGSNLTHLTDAFIKLNDKNGVVTSVNDVTGAVTLKIEATTDKLQLKVNNEMKSEVEIITNGEIDTMINDLN